jgi:HTH-type transcriptional regulator/antitoxin HigA
MSHRSKSRPLVADDYFNLVKRFPLRPLRGEKEYDAAAAMLDSLVLRELSEGEQDYLEALTRFVEDYDQKHRRPPGAKLSALARLRHLMTESQMTSADLGRVLGSASAASMILRGRRGISKAHLKKLADRFRVDAKLFLD